jgi:hypothetical protein
MATGEGEGEGEGEEDSDDDGLTDVEESYWGTNPHNPDTDGDGLSDGDEVHNCATWPRTADTDGDGIPDGEEVTYGADPLLAENASPEYNEMLRVLREMNSQLRQEATVPHLNDAIENAADYLRSQPAVSTVYFESAKANTDPRLWAEFANGITYVLFITPADDASGAKAAVADVGLADAEPLSSEQETSFADSRTYAQPPVKSGFGSSGFPELPALLVDLLDSDDFTTNVAAVDQMAQAHGYETEVFSFWDLTSAVDMFKTIDEYGVVYVCCHGIDVADDRAPQPRHYFALHTNERHNDTRDKEFLKGDFQAKRIVIGNTIIYGPEDVARVRPDLCYGVTDQFFNFYLADFEDHSFVWLNACHGMEVLPGVGLMPPLVQVLLNKHAGAVFGWTGKVRCAVAMQASGYFFTRMLGHNEAYDPQTPPIRPYDITDAFDATENRGYNKDPDNGTELVWVPRDYGTLDQENVLLVPPLFGLSLDLPDNELTLSGEFGQNGDPRITVGGQELSIKEQDENDIIADIPEDATGETKVEILDHESNPVPLTQWQGQFDIKGDLDGSKGPHFEGTLKFRFRSDIHSFRHLYPEDPPDQPISRMAVGTFERDSELQYEFSGTFVSGDYEYKYTGSGSVKPAVDPGEASEPPMLFGTCTLMPDDGKASFLGVAVLKANVTRRDLKTQEVNQYEENESISVILDASLEKYGAIKGGSANSGPLEVKWEDVTVDSPPDEKTPA